MNGIQQCVVSFSVFTDFYDLLFPGSPEHEESGSVSGEPGLLCLGMPILSNDKYNEKFHITLYFPALKSFIFTV